MQFTLTPNGAEARHKNAVREIVAATYPADQTQEQGAALNVAVYARYSTDGQKETSIDDQIRTCEETAKRHGMRLSKALIFADDAITGAAKATHKREQSHCAISRLSTSSGE